MACYLKGLAENSFYYETIFDSSNGSHLSYCLLYNSEICF